MLRNANKGHENQDMQLKNAARATVVRGNFGIKSFYSKIGGHVLTPKFGLGWELPEVKIRRGKPKYSTKLANRVINGIN